ncbi:MAG: molybdopterin-synthase adenylyltransferase MoeB, partial [Candidatus Obscuribacterales bacterium]|nr:molybdopterin-synthase adenylyltransferase MoeB [Candidatus Obscuribacterales bacterium]
MSDRGLSKSELNRYSRHLLLSEVGMDGQLRLKKARVLVVGAGGLGSPVIQYLAAAGVGTIGIVDFDTVDLSNLQRQVIYNTDDVSASKVERAVARARSLNPEIGVNAHDLRLSADNVLALIGDYDLVVDGTDNFSTRYLVNDACVLAGKPNVHAAIYRFEGQVSVFSFGDGPCYRCIFPDPPPPEMVPNCAEGGVLGVIAGVVGALQATEAIKIILESGAPLAGKLLIYDALAASFQTINL